MFSIMQTNIFVAIAAAILLNGCNACFQSDKHETDSIQTGNLFYKECQCMEPGYTIRNIKWLDINDQEIGPPGPGSNVFTEVQGDSINLHILSMSKTITGTYKCVTDFNGRRFTQSYNVEAYDPLYFTNTADDQYLIAGQDYMIHCEARGETDPLISWHKENELFEIRSNDKYQVVPNQGLIVKNVTIEDAGKYQCTAVVAVTGEEVVRFIQVKVMTVPVISEITSDPSPTEGNGSKISITEGQKLIIECIAEGMPHPEYKWKKISEIAENSSETWTQNMNTITFEYIEANDTGTYECFAYNAAGGARKEIAVEVWTLPEIVDFPNITTIEGSTIQLVCNAIGQPTPEVTIMFYAGTEYPQNATEFADVEIIPNLSTLHINRSNEGTYICNASNEVGYELQTMNLTVMHMPYFEKTIETIWGWNGKTVNLSCIHESNPPSIITWRYEGNDIPTAEQVEINKHLLAKLNNITEHYLPINIDNNSYYGAYECTARNLYGAATKKIILREGFKPQAIKKVVKMDVTATSITFSIEGPDVVNIPEILGYTAEYDETANYNITNIHNNRTWAVNRPFKIDKLKPNTSYDVKFAAINEVGTGIWSEFHEFKTLEKSVPEPPIFEMDSVELSPINSVLKWKAPEDNGDPLDYYSLRYCPVYTELEEALCKEERIKPTTELELSGLDYNTTYYFELVAHNSEGNSTAANISITTQEIPIEESAFLSGGALIGISIVVVILCLILLDLLLLVWRRQGIIASCCLKKNTKDKDDNLQSRDKKGLLKDNGESTYDRTKRPDNGHKEYEYNKTTGVITGKHSAV